MTREIDIKVAEAIGWKWVPTLDINDRPMFSEDEERPEYSTDVAAALSAIETFGRWSICKATAFASDETEYTVKLFDSGMRVDRPTLCEAVCEAILKAKGRE